MKTISQKNTKKQKKRKLLITAMLAATLLLHRCMAFGNTRVILYEDFDDGNYEGWTIESLGGGVLNVVPPEIIEYDPVNSPGKFSICGVSGGYRDPDCVASITHAIDAVQALEICVEVRAKSGSFLPNEVDLYLFDEHDYYAFTDYGENVDKLMWVRMDSVREVQWEYYIGTQAHEWHTFKWTRSADGWWSLSTDDVLVIPNIEWDNMITSFDHIQLQLFGGQSQIDWVKVRVPEPACGTGGVIADTVADFSGMQGQNNWYYGYYAVPGDPNSWVQMDYYYYDPQYGYCWHKHEFNANPWSTVVTKTNQWPEFDVPWPSQPHWSVRRYISEAEGDFTISGFVSRQDPLGHGDGSQAHVYVDGTEVWSHTVPPTHPYGYEFSIPVSVQAGDAIDFVVSPLGNSWYDSTLFTAQICRSGDPIENISIFVEDSLDAGTLTGSGPGKSAEGRLGAFFNMIEAAGHLLDAELPNGACEQLQCAYNRCDGESLPPDFVEGPATAELADMIQDLMLSLVCE